MAKASGVKRMRKNIKTYVRDTLTNTHTQQEKEREIRSKQKNGKEFITRMLYESRRIIYATKESAFPMGSSGTFLVSKYNSKYNKYNVLFKLAVLSHAGERWDKDEKKKTSERLDQLSTLLKIFIINNSYDEVKTSLNLSALSFPFLHPSF